MSLLTQNPETQTDDLFFSKTDNAIWERLYVKQCHQLKPIANPVFLENLKKFNLPATKVPSLSEISKQLNNATGWGVTPVDGLINYKNYFSLLAKKSFPAAMFMRSEEQENLCKDPDLFHEVFGHCTMLLSQEYADFMEEFAQFALTVKACDRPLFSRLIWFGTETALIKIGEQLKIFGSSVLSSYQESDYAINSKEPTRKPFDIVNIFREPYRADILQTVYYVLDNTKQLYSILDDIPSLYDKLEQARSLGELPLTFEQTNSRYSNIGNCVSLTELQ